MKIWNNEIPKSLFYENNKSRIPEIVNSTKYENMKNEIPKSLFYENNKSRISEIVNSTKY